MNSQIILRIRKTGEEIISNVFEFYKYAEILNKEQIKEIEKKILDSENALRQGKISAMIWRKGLKSSLGNLTEEEQIKKVIKKLISEVRNEENINDEHLNN